MTDERFIEHPETVEGDVSAEFVKMVLCIHPNLPYPSATAALMCRQAYDLGRHELRAQLAALRPVAEAAVAWEGITAETDRPREGVDWPKEMFRADRVLREAVRALPPEWREAKAIP